MPSLPRALCAVFLLVISPATAETAQALTNILNVDTRGGTDGIDVTGRVVHAQTKLPLAGVSVSLAGIPGTTTSTGGFSFAGISLVAGNTLNVSLSGFTPQSRTIAAPAGTKAVNVGDILLAPAVAGQPVVESLLLAYPRGVYLRGLPANARPLLSRPTATVRVNWNGQTPGSVEFRGNGALIGTRTGAGPEYTLEVPIDTAFPPRPGASELRVIAKTAGGTTSPAFILPVHVVSLPTLISNLAPNADTWPGNFAVDFNFPFRQQDVTLPVLGRFGAEFALGGSFDYTFDDGSWEAALGVSGDGKQGKRARRPTFPGITRYPKPKLYIGNQEINAGIYGVAQGSSIYDPFVIDQFGLNMTLGWKGELTRYTLGLPPGVGSALNVIPGASKVLDNLSIILYLTVGGDGYILFRPAWPLEFSEATMETRLGLEAAYEPKITNKIKGRLYVGGEGRLKVGVPSPIFREAGFKVYAGLSAEAYFLSVSREWVLVEYAWGAGRRLHLDALHDIGTGYMIEAAANKDADWQSMPRPWREAGPEVFLFADPDGPDRRDSLDPHPALESFAAMAAAPAPGAVHTPAAGPGRRIADNPELPAQAALPLLQNVFPNSEPSVASHGTSHMLVYLRDTGVENPAHFTEVAWTRFDGTSWSAPAALAPDPRGQFAPRVAFDGTGAAVAVWERVKDPAYQGSDLTEIAARVELVAARWNPATQAWGAPVALTDNAHLDHDAHLAGPLANGDLLLAWRENPANQFEGSGAASAPTNSRVPLRRWNASTATWGAVSAVVDNLTGEGATSFAAAGNKAVFVWSRDLDGDPETETDQEIFHRVWNETTSTWSPVTRLTDDAIADRNARVALHHDGSVFLLWQRGDDLVMDRDLAATPVAVREDSSTAGFSDFAISIAPGGHVVALWQEMTDTGTDAHLRVFDPASNTWGLDTLLSADSDIERSFATAWDPMGNLVLAYNNVEVTMETVSVEIEGGEIIEIEGVPQPGRVDLLVAKRALVQDLEIPAGGLTAEGNDFLPGDEILLRATVRNSGNVAVQNPAVAFYNGDPDEGGSLIGTTTIPGWLRAAESADVEMPWTIPTPAIARTVFAVVDPAGLVTEFTEENNLAILLLNAVDLQVGFASGDVLRDGSARVVARVRNLSAPASPVATLRLFEQAGGTLLAEAPVSVLAPGEAADIPLDLPPGTQPEDPRHYRLVVDEDGLTGDADATNNESLFALSLWIDDDGNGLPDSWEILHYGHTGVDPHADADGDGFSNLQEYLAGTHPRDGTSYLRIGQVAQLPQAQGGGTFVSWASVEGRHYKIERSFDLSHWTTIEENAVATPPLNTFLDPAAPPDGRVFYRIAVP